MLSNQRARPPGRLGCMSTCRLVRTAGCRPASMPARCSRQQAWQPLWSCVMLIELQRRPMRCTHWLLSSAHRCTCSGGLFAPGRRSTKLLCSLGEERYTRCQRLQISSSVAAGCLQRTSGAQAAAGWMAWRGRWGLPKISLKGPEAHQLSNAGMQGQAARHSMGTRTVAMSTGPWWPAQRCGSAARQGWRQWWQRARERALRRRRWRRQRQAPDTRTPRTLPAAPLEALGWRAWLQGGLGAA